MKTLKERAQGLSPLEAAALIAADTMGRISLVLAQKRQPTNEQLKGWAQHFRIVANELEDAQVAEPLASTRTDSTR